jgi:molecular chaperone GrpE
MTDTPGGATNAADATKNQIADAAGAQAPNGAAEANPANSANGKAAEAAGTVAGVAEAAETPKTIEAQLAEAQAKAAEYLDGWQRARAEFMNYRKRADKEREEAFQTASIDMLKKLLPVIDDFDRAVATLPVEKANDELVKGFSLIHRKLAGLLESAGIKPINPTGEAFDPAFHEALGQDDSTGLPSGHVTAVLQKGYIYGDKVLRPALVRVSA